MSEENLSENVSKWNEILEEVISDTKTLAKDLKGSINFVGLYAGAAVTSALLYINLILTTQGKPQIVYILYYIGFGANIALAVWGGQKFLSYRTKFERFYQIYKKLE